MVARLSFKFFPSEFSNDHQIRAMIDGRDLLQMQDDKSLGIDPAEFFSQRALHGCGQLLIGRCSCGCVGCGDVAVFVSRSSNEVEWLTISPAEKYVFEISEYDLALESAAADFSWETVERTAERLVSKLDYSEFKSNGLLFKWASARIKNDRITLCFDASGLQKLYDAPWDHKTAADALIAVRELLPRLIKNLQS